MNKEKINSQSYAEVTNAVGRYYDALAQADSNLLEQLTNPVWNRKTYQSSTDRVAVEGKDEFIARILAHGPTSMPDDQNHLTSVQVYFDDFSIARMDDWKREASSIHTLYKLHGKWNIVGEVYAAAEIGTRQSQFNPQTAEAEVLAVLDVYYRAVETGDPDALRPIFDPGWEMKNHEDNKLVAEDKGTFMERLATGPLAGYAEDRQITDVQIVYDRLAYVRVDKPSKTAVTVFLFFRLANRWVVVDKAFSFLGRESV